MERYKSGKVRGEMLGAGGLGVRGYFSMKFSMDPAKLRECSGTAKKVDNLYPI